MSDYIPINCNLHDRLEALATVRKQCQVIYQTSEGEIIETLDILADIYTENKEEFVKLGSGNIIRLDALLEVDGQSYRSKTAFP